MIMDTCGQRNCPGHHHKFSDCLTEALYTLACESGSDDWTGDTDFRGHFDLFNDIGPDVDLILDEGMEDERVVIIPPGTYLVMTDSHGFVYNLTFGNDEELHQRFAEEEDAYEEYAKDEDE